MKKTSSDAKYISRYGQTQSSLKQVSKERFTFSFKILLLRVKHKMLCNVEVIYL